jgi:hypothetical protein
MNGTGCMCCCVHGALLPFGAGLLVPVYLAYKAVKKYNAEIGLGGWLAVLLKSLLCHCLFLIQMRNYAELKEDVLRNQKPSPATTNGFNSFYGTPAFGQQMHMV